jgi:hypothetical protein
MLENAITYFYIVAIKKEVNLIEGSRLRPSSSGVIKLKIEYKI